MNTTTDIRKPESHAGFTPTHGSLPDWQIVTIISDTDYQEVNCNGGGHRRIRKSKCSCGQPVLIEFDSKQTCRRDKLRIFYPDQPDTGWCVFRCKGCGEPIGDNCKDAAYDKVENE
jgi:hypothetical protein